MKSITLTYSGPSRVEPIQLPLSKSVALRAMTLNVVSEIISGTVAAFPELPDAEDVAGMKRAIRCLRDSLRERRDLSMENGNNSQTIQPDHRPTGQPQISDLSFEANRVNIGEGGAPFRFFTALAASIPDIDMTLTTGRPLIRRPHAILFDTLRKAGADIRCIRRHDRPPLHIRGQQLDPGSLSMNPGVSSQFVSALMMAAPLWGRGLDLKFEGRAPVSVPYLEMTRKIMESFGCDVEMTEEHISVAPGKCTAPTSQKHTFSQKSDSLCHQKNPESRYEIPTDWSAASYFYELALLLPGQRIDLLRLTPPAESLQGDSACAEIFARLGVKTEYRNDGSAYLLRPTDLPVNGQIDQPYVLDLNGTPDLAPALAVGFCLAGVRFRFENVAHLRHKETDRMASLETELRKLGYIILTGDDSMAWLGERCEAQAHPVISTYSDHRMAMAFAPAAIRFPGLTIENPDVIAKSFPRYWEMIERLGFQP